MRSTLRPWILDPLHATPRLRGCRARGALALAALLALPGCSSAGHDGGESPAGPAAAPPANGGVVSNETGPRIERLPVTAVPVPAGTDAATGAAPGAVPAELLAAARADLEKRLAAGNAAGPIRVLIAQAVTWSDGSLGCAQPGVNYTMALVPGYRVVFGVRTGTTERQYAYHSGRSGPLVYCANPAAPAAASSTA